MLTRRHHDAAIIRGPQGNEFECGFTPDTWDNVAGLLEPFAAGNADGYQWLAQSHGDAALMISAYPGGGW